MAGHASPMYGSINYEAQAQSCTSCLGWFDRSTAALLCCFSTFQQLMLALDFNGPCECCSSVSQKSVVAKGAEGRNGAEHAHSQHQQWQTDLLQEFSCSPAC